MKITKWSLFLTTVCTVFLIMGLIPGGAHALWQGFDQNNLSHMSDFDPKNVVAPKGDTVKIGLLEPTSGAAALQTIYYYPFLAWIAHDINKQGGIMVDGKVKMMEVVKGDTQMKPAVARKAAEKLILLDKVDALWGSAGSHISKAIMPVAKKYKKIYLMRGISTELMDPGSFNKYTFSMQWTTYSIGTAIAMYYVPRPEKKFYVICQDYLYGRSAADAFKNALKKYKPDAQIVGEDYHPLFHKDYAPYISKIKASGADVIFTADWDPDLLNLAKQARQMGVMQPFAGPYTDHPGTRESLGIEWSKGNVVAQPFLPQKKYPLLVAWNKQWQKWKKPYNGIVQKWPWPVLSGHFVPSYWMMDVIRRAGTTDPEKIIEVWEGDEYTKMDGRPMKMRACDHRLLTPAYVSPLTHPNQWHDNLTHPDKVTVIPAKDHVVPPPDMKRCR